MERADSFVVNIPRADQATIVDYCGSVSGLDVDKYDKLGLSVLQSSKVFSPGIMEFPVNIECVKRRSVELGSHTYYFGEIVAVRCDESVVEGGRIVGSSLDPMCTFLRQYWRLGEPVIGINSTSKAVG
jgi:flavin reductase (DIM6/NTAB) family NADH-FMN oxidoreductase RutF